MGIPDTKMVWWGAHILGLAWRRVSCVRGACGTSIVYAAACGTRQHEMWSEAWMPCLYCECKEAEILSDGSHVFLHDLMPSIQNRVV
jgi:hypothetical protein